MASERRIIPISSGKGGVGKTTLALNYALSLSRHGPTLLLDLDTGTSSVRNCLDTPVTRDLYHFFKKGYALADCVTSLRPELDPAGHYRAFGFVAAPRHLIEDVTHFNRERRERLIDAINTLPASFVVLDLKSGLDASVIEFLPFTNSGMLVFTPHLPAATLAASDIVKAILFRKLRTIFAPGSPIYAGLGGVGPDFINGLIDRAEDVYDAGVHTLDAFVQDLRHALEEHALVERVAEAVDSFVVHYVLNMFNGVAESYETAVRPFVEALAENVSAHLTILNLGWVVAHDDVNRANQDRVPVLLQPESAPPSSLARDAASLQIEQLAAQYLGRRAPRPPAAPGARPAPSVGASRYLDVQLDTLRRMYDGLRGASYRQNFKYITYRSLHVMRSRGIRDLGDTRIFKPAEIQGLLVERLTRPSLGDWSATGPGAETG
jgi:MinD-like ATPase involved in chromosome partitioning or flagellar assembly